MTAPERPASHHLGKVGRRKRERNPLTSGEFLTGFQKRAYRSGFETSGATLRRSVCATLASITDIHHSDGIEMHAHGWKSPAQACLPVSLSPILLERNTFKVVDPNKIAIIPVSALSAHPRGRRPLVLDRQNWL